MSTGQKEVSENPATKEYLPAMVLVYTEDLEALLRKKYRSRQDVLLNAADDLHCFVEGK